MTLSLTRAARSLTVSETSVTTWWTGTDLRYTGLQGLTGQRCTGACVVRHLIPASCAALSSLKSCAPLQTGLGHHVLGLRLVSIPPDHAMSNLTETGARALNESQLNKLPLLIHSQS